MSPLTEVPAVFRRIVCATDGSPAGDEAVRQAARIAAAGAAALEVVGPERVLERAPGHDLLVMPPADAEAVTAAARAPVLVARPSPGSTESILVAVDDSQSAHDAVRVGATLAANLGVPVAIVASPEHHEHRRRALRADVSAVCALTGTDPVVLDEQSAPVAAILRAAKSCDATLIVLGSRPGTPSASVSRAVAARAPCSVLVLRPGRTANY